MAERVIKCKNADGVTMTFTERGFEPYLLVKASGIYDVNNTIYQSNNTMMDGAEYQGSVMQPRNIVLTLKEIDDFADNRDQISVLFDKGAPGTLTVLEEDHERQIEYYVESISTTATPNVRLTTVSLICPDPYFYDPYETVRYILDIQPHFEWPHNFLAEGEEFSFVNDALIGAIDNETADDHVGLTLILTALGTVVNPSIHKIQTNEKLKINKTIAFGDQVIFTTTVGSKNVMMIHNGVIEEINHLLTDDSVFFQLTRGLNEFGVDADSGKSYLSAKISCRYKYLRA